MYRSVALSAFTVWCYHRYYPSTELFSSCKTETLYLLNNKFTFLSPLTPWQPSMSLTTLGTLHKCSRTVCVLEWLAYFTYHNVFKVHPCCSMCSMCFLLTCLFIYLFLERGEGREKKRERNMDIREKHRPVASLMCPDQGLNPQCRHASWPGIGPVTLCSGGWRPTNWATPARAHCSFYLYFLDDWWCSCVYWSLVHFLWSNLKTILN